MLTKSQILRDPLIFLDIETGGFNPDLDAIVEVAIVDIEGRTLYNKSFPAGRHRVELDAADINGYGTYRPTSDLPFTLADMFDVEGHLTGKTIVGSNPFFDVSFLMGFAKKNYGRQLKANFRTIDIKSLAQLHFGTARLSLSGICGNLGLELEGSDTWHCALTDALMCRKAYMKLLDLTCPPDGA